MDRSRIRMIFACLLPLLALACSGIPKNWMSLPKAYEVVQKGAPIGATKEKAEKWAKRNGYSFTTLAAPAKDPDVVAMGVDMNEIGEVCEVMIYDINRSINSVSDARILLFLDKDGKVKYHKVKMEMHKV